jgi:hypothetical protein
LTDVAAQLTVPDWPLRIVAEADEQVNATSLSTGGGPGNVGVGVTGTGTGAGEGTVVEVDVTVAAGAAGRDEVVVDATRVDDVVGAPPGVVVVVLSGTPLSSDGPGRTVS